jgi:hypothetical protein
VTVMGMVMPWPSAGTTLFMRLAAT